MISSNEVTLLGALIAGAVPIGMGLWKVGGALATLQAMVEDDRDKLKAHEATLAAHETRLGTVERITLTPPTP
jgi:hypothetical protein